MIPVNNIEKKDFSTDLPVISDKLHALAAGMANTANNEEFMEPPAISGVASILMDVIDDIDTINKALYADKNQTPESRDAGMDRTENGRER